MIALTFLQQIRLKRRELTMLAGMITLYFFSYFQRVAVPGTVFNELQVDFNASAAAITALGALFLYIYGFWQIFAGMLTDRFGGMRMLLIGGLLMTAGALMFPLARTLFLLYATRILLAFGASFMFISLIKVIDSLFERRHFAMLLSITLFFGYSGGLFATLPLERSVAFFGWRASFFGIGLITAVALLGNYWLMQKNRRLDTQASGAGGLPIKVVLRNSHSWRIASISIVHFAVYFLFQATIGKKMLSDTCGLNSARAAVIMFGMLLTCMVFTSLSGFLTRMIGNRRKPLIIGGTSLNMAALAFMLWILAHPSPAAGPMAAGCILLGIGVSISPLLISTMKEVNPEEAAATSVGLINCMAYLGVAAFTNLAGIAMDAFRNHAVVTAQAVIYPAGAYRAIMLGCLLASGVAWINSCFIPETRGRCIYRRRSDFD